MAVGLLEDRRTCRPPATSSPAADTLTVATPPGVGTAAFGGHGLAGESETCLGDVVGGLGAASGRRGGLVLGAAPLERVFEHGKTVDVLLTSNIVEGSGISSADVSDDPRDEPPF